MTSSEYFHLIRDLRKKVNLKTLFVARHFKGCLIFSGWIYHMNWCLLNVLLQGILVKNQLMCVLQWHKLS